MWVSLIILRVYNLLFKRSNKMDVLKWTFGLLAVIFMVVGCSTAQECEDHPADVVFVMDSSGSIHSRDFAHLKKFVQNIVKAFDVAEDKTRFGAVSFSNWAFLQFHLDKYYNKEDILAQLGKIQHMKGDTNTASAISYMRDVMFANHNGARNVFPTPQIAIILTDGRSNVPMLTKYNAWMAHQVGIHMFVIGIGSEVDSNELKSIASQPHDSYIFEVGDYTALQYIKDLVVNKACMVTDSPTTIIPQTAFPPPSKYCRDSPMTDVVFAVAPAASLENTEKSLAFYKEASTNFDISDDKVRIGVVPKDCEPDNGHGSNNEQVMRLLTRLINKQTTTVDVIRYMRRTSFRPKFGARPGARNVGVIMVEAGDDLARAQHEADKAKRSRNIELFVIGIGIDLDKKKIQELASNPADQHFWHIDSYDELPGVMIKLLQGICPVMGL